MYTTKQYFSTNDHARIMNLLFHFDMAKPDPLFLFSYLNSDILSALHDEHHFEYGDIRQTNLIA